MREILYTLIRGCHLLLVVILFRYILQPVVPIPSLLLQGSAIATVEPVTDKPTAKGTQEDDFTKLTVGIIGAFGAVLAAIVGLISAIVAAKLTTRSQQAIQRQQLEREREEFRTRLEEERRKFLEQLTHERRIQLLEHRREVYAKFIEDIVSPVAPLDVDRLDALTQDQGMQEFTKTVECLRVAFSRAHPFLPQDVRRSFVDLIYAGTLKEAVSSKGAIEAFVELNVAVFKIIQDLASYVERLEKEGLS